MKTESTVLGKSRPSSGDDRRVGVLLLVFCAVGWVATTTFREVPAMLSQNVPPTFFPRLVLVAMALLSGLLVFIRPSPSGVTRDTIGSRVWVTAGIFLTAVALVPYLGMLLTVALVAVVLPLYWGERRKSRLALLALLLPAGLYALFALGLGMRFPGGIFG